MNLPRSFGPYTLLRRLAVGGMAEIYVAKTLGLGGFEKLAALKLVHPHLSADPQFVRMLIDEAKILVLLTHANIAQVFDLGSIDGTYFIAMEYVEGIDVQGLERAAKRLGRPLPISVCCFIVSEMLNGLDYAHRKRDQSGRPLGIVHRDISPQNVVVSRAGEIKLVDFGIAKSKLRLEGTEVGVIKGKYGYMSPEQAWADPTDRRSDVFSAGIMLYELLTGNVLYTARSVAELITKVRRAEIVPPNEVRPEIPERLSSIVMRALAVEPSDRYQSALEMGDALREFLYRSSQPFSGARLGRYVSELLDADERLAAERAQVADETGGLRALRREDFLRNDNSVLFTLPDPPPGRDTPGRAGETIPARARKSEEPRESTPESRNPIARALASERVRDPVPPVSLRGGPTSSTPSTLSTLSTPERAVRAAASEASAQDMTGDEVTELWTQRWFARQGTLDFAPEIHVQEDTGEPTERRLALANTEHGSIAPPTLSWPPFTSGHSRSAERVDTTSPPALMPPRGEDPSLGPLPRSPAMPNLRRPSNGLSGRREILLLIALLLLGALGALIAWESRPASVLELISVPSGASVYINDALQPGTTPLRVSGLRRGASYRIRLDLAGHQPHEIMLQAAPGVARQTVQLVPK